MSTILVITITVAASIIAAAVIAGVMFGGVAVLLDVLRARHARFFEVADIVDAEYLSARRAMNDAAGQSWRNLID